ncbi:MAG: GWxTD domain-containing protein [Candidatus Aminicenantes bacterium]
MKTSRGLIIGLLVLSLAACTSFRRERDLSPRHEEFFSKVRYIITKQEKKIFLNLPQEERDAFIKEFWEKRDPTPDTEINEFKEKYFQRIEEANQLFSRGQTDGWLKDRGRIYILLGPPGNREQYPRGVTFYGRPTEIWFYGPYPIIFTDEYYSGEYRLYPGSAQYVANLLQAQMDLKPEVEEQEVVFDFKLNLEKFPDNRVRLSITIPMENVFLKEKNGNLSTILSAQVQVYSGNKKIKTAQEESPITVNQEEFLELMGKKHVIPVEIQLEPGRFRFIITVSNSADEQVVEKTIKFKL